LIGTYDPNRDWDGIGNPLCSKWCVILSRHALKLALIKAFIVNHPLLELRATHYGGMFLRGPGAAEDDALFAARDIEVYDNIGS
jgi:hypothetical protein